MKRGLYRRVPGVGRSSNAVLSCHHRLWLAPDHLLSVCNQGYAEDYKRFYLKDIQAISMRQSRRGRVINAVLGSIVAAFVLLAGATALYGRAHAWSPVGAWVLAEVAALFLLALLINMAMGPTCVCTLRTAVQAERLYSLVRVRKALRALRMIREAVEAAQGALAPDLMEGYAAQAAARGAPTSARSHEAPLLMAMGDKPYRGRAHAALFTLLLVDLYHSLMQFAWQSSVLYAFNIAIMLTLVVSLIVAVIRQSGTDLPRGLKATTWWVMGYMIVAQMVGAFVGVIIGMARAGQGRVNQWDLVRSMWMTSPFDSMPILVLLVFSAVCSGVLGVVGWVQLRAFHRRRRQPPPLASVPPLPTA